MKYEDYASRAIIDGLGRVYQEIIYPFVWTKNPSRSVHVNRAKCQLAWQEMSVAAYESLKDIENK